MSEDPTVTKSPPQSNQDIPTVPGPILAGTQPKTPQPDELRKWPILPGYEIQGEIGAGGMGVVYRALQQNLHRVVAVKMVRGAAHAPHDVLVRFLHEAELEARLAHPNFVQVYEVGSHEGCPFFSMEYVPGGSLAQKLAHSAVPAEQAARWIITLATAMHYAHQQGIIHRDLKPANVMVTADGTLKITDFGLAKHLNLEGGLTQSGAVMGTPAYMAPEQARGYQKLIGPCTDIYALGAILYEMLTGRPPFTGGASSDVLADVIAREPEAPSRLRPGIPADLETICLHCLEKPPQRRYATALDLAADLERVLQGEPIRARRTSAWRRGWMWARRRPGLSTALACLVFFILGSIGFGAWYASAYWITHEEYYANSTYHYGSQEGVGRLTKRQMERRAISLRLFRRAGRVLGAEFVDCHGRLTFRYGQTTLVGSLSGGDSTSQIPCRLTYEYNDRGQTTAETCRDPNDTLLWTFHYDTPDSGHFSDKNGFVRGHQGSGAAHVEFKWTREGFRQDTYYCDSRHNPQPGENGAYGIHIESDERGLPVRITNLGADRKPILQTDGTAGSTRKYNAQGDLTEITYIDEKGQPALHKDGYARMVSHYDADGNPVRFEFFGRDGQPVLLRDGYAIMITEYDSDFHAYRNRFLGKNGKPVLITGGFACLQRTYDASGYCTSESYLGLDDKPTATLIGFSTIRWTYDARGHRSSEAYFDATGQPALHPKGYARSAFSRDEAGNLLEETFFGLDGKPIATADGYARRTIAYDDRGNPVERKTFDARGQPAIVQGACSYTSRYDDRGNIVELRYFGQDGKPCIASDGYAICDYGYDDHGRATGETYRGLDGKPTPCREGYARTRVTRDDHGNPTEVAYFGTDDRPTCCRRGYAIMRKVYDARGLVLEESYSGTDGKPVSNTDGYAKQLNQLDSCGRVLESSYFDTDGKLVLTRSGYARQKFGYDERGNRLQTENFGPDDRPIRSGDGFSRSAATFDSRGRLTGVTYFGVDGKRTENSSGFSAYRAKSDDQGHRIEESYFDRSDQPILLAAGFHMLTSRYDARGNQTETAFRGLKGELVTARLGGYARRTTVYDERGNCTKQSLFDPAGKPVAGNDGYATFTATYDSQGNRTSCNYEDANGAWPQAHPNERMKYDERGNLREVNLLDGQGKPIANGRHPARITCTYDERGNRLSRSTFDASGAPCSPIATETMAYDDQGHQVEYFALDRFGKPIVDPTGYSGWRARYDGRGNLLEKTYLGADRQPIPGAAREVQEFDGRNQLIRISYYTGTGAPALHQGRYFTMHRTYDAFGTCIATTYSDREDKLLGVHPRVSNVLPGSIAVRLDIQPGDVILAYGNKPVTSTAAFLHRRSVTAASGVNHPLELDRNGQHVTIALPPGIVGMELEDHLMTVNATPTH